MAEIRQAIILDLSGNLQGRARALGRELEAMGSRSSRALAGLKSAARAAGDGLDRLGNRYTALLTGAAGVGAVRGVMAMQERLTMLGIQANVTDARMEDLRQRLVDVARSADIRVRPGGMLDAVDAIVEKTGDLAFAEENLRNIGLAMRATGAEGRAIGDLLAEFQKMGIKGAGSVLTALDVLNVQGKEGAFTLRDLAALGPRVVTAYTSMGRTGVPALREMGAALQMIRMGTGSSEMAATAFEAVIRTLSDPAKLKLLQKAGIQIFDAESAKRGLEVLRPINEIMVDLVKRSGGSKSKLGTIFDAEAIRAFNQALSEFKRTGGIESLDRFMKVQADGTETTKDAARAARTMSAAITSLAAAGEKLADEKLSGPIQRLADAFNSMDAGQVDRLLDRLVTAGTVLGGLFFLKKGLDFAGSVRGVFGRRGGSAAPGVPGSGLPLPLPVYVVNKHLSLLPGSWAGGAGAGGAAAGGAAAGAAALSNPLTVAAVVKLAAAPAVIAAAVGAASVAVAKGISENRVRSMSTRDLIAERKRRFGHVDPDSYTSRLIDEELRTRADPSGFGEAIGPGSTPSHMRAAHALEGKIKIEVTDARVKVKSVQSRGFDFDTGPMGATP